MNRLSRIPTILLLLPIWLMVVTADAALPRDPAKHFFEQTLGDLTDDLADAKSNGKKGVMIFFEQDECPFCHRMKSNVLNQVRVQEYFQKHFLVLSIDIESTEELVTFDGKSMTKKDYFNQITRNRGATPVFAFFDESGQLVTRYTGATTGIDEFLWLGEYVKDKVYQTTTFSRYKRQKRQELRENRN